MRRVTTVVAMVLSASVLCADAYQPLQILDQTERAVTVTNGAISVHVEHTGRITHLKAGETEYVGFVALYSTPRSFETNESIRAVQGETGEARGIGGTPAPISVGRRGEHILIHTDVTAAREEICGGAPLYRLRQWTRVTPNGTLGIRYQFDWLRLFFIDRPYIAIALMTDVFAGAHFVADYTGHQNSGIYGDTEDYVRIDALTGGMRTVRYELPDAPVEIWFDDAARISNTRWGTYYVLTADVPGTIYRGLVYPGTSSTMDFTIKLPSSTVQGGAQ